MNVQLHLTDDTQLRAWGFVLGGALLAHVYWDCSLPENPHGHGSIGGTPAMRRLAALATQAAIQAEEEACWHAHQAATAEEWVA